MCLKKFAIIIGLIAASRVSAQNISFVDTFPNVAFTQPIEMAMAPDQSDRFFIVQQNGLIRVFPNKNTIVQADVKTFLNLTNKIIAGGERGLLGLAFHPDYKNNGYFYVNYTRPNPLTSVISRFKVGTDANKADSLSEQILFTQTQPYTNHNGGKLTFGNDGYFYISLGDGGSGGDPENNGQTLTTLLGKILRIDVNNTIDTLKYSYPPDNPFVNNTVGYRKEIFAYGLRNVWKFSVDRLTGTLWAGDVGQNRAEEIDTIVNGGNYGWKVMEGFQCYPVGSVCDQTGLLLPVYEYTRANNDRSVTGGYVYRGIQIPEWYGKYIYGDFVSGRVWRLHVENNVATNNFILSAGGNVSSFAEDDRGEIYVLIYGTGKVWRFLPEPPASPENLIVTRYPDENAMQWSDNANNELGFIVERSWFYNLDFVVMDTVANNITTYTDAIGNDTTTYTYRVKAYNDGGSSGYVFVSDIILNNEEDVADEFDVYPNPASGWVNFKCNTSFEVRIIDAVGKESFRQKSEAGFLSVQLEPGIYFARVRTSAKTFSRKVVVK